MGARLTAWAGLAAATTLLLAGCGSDSDGDAADDTAPTTSAGSTPTESTAAADATTTPAPAGTPTCGEVWAVGTKLPRAYRGCADDAGNLVAPDDLGCSSGQALVRYDDRFWAVRGGEIAGGKADLAASADYRKVVATCRG